MKRKRRRRRRLDDPSRWETVYILKAPKQPAQQPAQVVQLEQV